MVTQLSFELLLDPVDRGGNVFGFGFGPEGLPRDPQRRLDALESIGPRMVLVDELDLDPCGARLEALQRSQLPLGRHAAVLVFAPTLACRSLRPIARTSAAIELPPSPGSPGQVLHLNRAMLSDQRSPYVGRFARGWHRLPGRFPGQPQTRTWARRRIGTTTRNAQRRDGIVERAS